MTDIIVPDVGFAGVGSPQGCLLSDLRASVRTVTKDDLGSSITDANIDGWLNEAQRDLATRLRILQTEITGTTGIDSTIPVPSDLIALHWLKLDGALAEVQFVNDATFMSWSDEAGTPSVTLGRIFAENIELYPGAVSTGYTLRYEYDPVEMVDDADRSSLPKQFCPKMVNYARSHALYKDGDGSMGDRYMILYDEGLPSPAFGKGRLNPGPMTLTFQRGPFDTADAAHW